MVKPAPVCRRGFCWQYEGSEGRLLQVLGARYGAVYSFVHFLVVFLWAAV